MSGILYIVGTPIGNLGDFSPRAQEVLHKVAFIAAEDTRTSRKLLTHFGIQTPMVSYHQHNQKKAGGEIIARLVAGENVAIITDAGMPCISDPGEDLVHLAAKEGIPIAVVPGPSAVIGALALSGLDTRRFVFEGFLEGKPQQQKKYLETLVRETRTLVFYEAPHRLHTTLQLLHQVLGDRPIALCRELTKLYEETWRTTLAEAVAYYEQHTPRGEFVLVVAGNTQAAEAIPLATAVAMVIQRTQQGEGLSAAAKEVATLSGYSKRELYQAVLQEDH